MNLLHSIKAHGTDSLINVVVEIPSGSQTKTEYDIDKEVFAVDRVLYTKYSYPFNYGFIPETWSADNDPLDVVLLSSQSISTGTLVESRVIGVLVTKDEEGTDEKIIAVPDSKADPFFSEINTIDNLDEKILSKIEHFYKNYKISEPDKWVDIDGYLSKEEAEKILTDAIEQYHQHFQK
jgi:inorganic pyrophosphatase